jgi:hypothetical protein
VKYNQDFYNCLGVATQWAVDNFSKYGFSIEIFPDEILDGGRGLDIALVQSMQGVMWDTPELRKLKFWERIANVHQAHDGTVEVYYFYKSEKINKMIEKSLNKYSAAAKNAKFKVE